MNETKSNNNDGFKTIVLFCLFSIIILLVDIKYDSAPVTGLNFDSLVLLISLVGSILVPLSYLYDHLSDLFS